jgi:hypothetical protein
MLAVFLETGPLNACIAQWSLAPRTKYEVRVQFGTLERVEKWTISLVNPGCPTITFPGR